MEKEESIGRFRRAVEAPIFGLAAATLMAIVIGVVIAMRHDVRWLLALAWPCAIVMVWEFTRIVAASKVRVRWVTLCGAVVSGAALLVLYVALAPSDGVLPPPSAEAPPIGSLRFVTATLEIEFKQSTGQTAARIEAELHNDSNRPISFHAVTAGNINGIAFDVNKVEFDGYVPAHESSFLISNRVTDVPINEQTDIKDPNVVGIYEYDLAYRYTGEEKFVRRSARGLKIASWSIIKRGPVGTVTKTPVLIIIYNVVEE